MTKLSANEQKRDKAAATGRHGWARISPIIDWTCAEVDLVGLRERITPYPGRSQDLQNCYEEGNLFGRILRSQQKVYEVYAVGLLERGTRLKEEKQWGSPNRKRCIKGRNLQAKETDCNDSMDEEVQKG